MVVKFFVKSWPFEPQNYFVVCRQRFFLLPYCVTTGDFDPKKSISPAQGKIPSTGIFSKIFQDFIGFLVSIFTKLDNKSDFIAVLTRELIPSFIQNLNLIANIIQFSFFDF